MIKLKWSNPIKKYYINKGYIFTMLNDEFNVALEDLNVNSNFKVLLICDYCNENFFQRYNTYNKNKQSLINKDCCNKCKIKKTNEVIKKNHNVDHNFKIPYVQKNRKETLIKNYGVDHNFKSEIIKETIKQTNLEKYGVEYPMQNKDIKDKFKLTSIERYGTEHPLQNKDVQNNIKISNMEKYGVEYLITRPDIKKKIKESMYKNGTAPSSKQQRYLCKLLGGELNYPLDFCYLDIAYPEEMIYIEYDGSGHNLPIKHGCSEEKFKKYELQRQNYLKSKGWKLIRIISSKDLLPIDDEIIFLIDLAKCYLNKNYLCIEINIDEFLIKNIEDQLEINCNLRRIKDDGWDDVGGPL